MTQAERKLALLCSTISVIARDGLDKTTTRAIATEANLNEAYIYQLFDSKEDLFKEVFATLDDELVSIILFRLPVMYMESMDFETRCRALFFSCWRFILGNKDKCLCFIRYYYSPYFKKYSYDEHNKRYQSVLEKMTPAFRKKSNVWMLLNHILNTMLDFAVKVFNGDINDNDDTAEHVFLVIYSSVKPYIEPHHLINKEG
ncbi:MAG: TetR/AcrR family transcriptional regulator [Clostridia bacterium]|nr:TetR/AcrR family transcriptional regulator [Clostridia bacterium]